MSDTAAEILQAFATRFGVPFLRGEAVTVGDFLGEEGHDGILHGMTIDPRLVDAAERNLEEAALLTEVTPAPFDEDAATFLYAVHELFASCHPQNSSFYSRGHTFCEAAAERVLKLRRTEDASRLLTRHLIVERAFRTTRSDVHVKWWTGSKSFYGEDAPERLLAWPGLRRVNVDRQLTPMWRLALVDGDEESRVARATLMKALLDLSPLTRLFLLGAPIQKELGFALVMPFKHRGRRMSPMYLLDDRRIARSVTDALLTRGVELAGPMLALALLQTVREGGPPLAQRRAAELCTHLFLMMCMIELQRPGSKESAPLRSLLEESVEDTPDSLRVYWAVVKSVLALDEQIFEAPDLKDFPPGLEEVWRRTEQRLAHKHITVIADPLTRELARRLPATNKAAQVAAQKERGARAALNPSG